MASIVDHRTRTERKNEKERERQISSILWDHNHTRTHALQILHLKWRWKQLSLVLLKRVELVPWLARKQRHNESICARFKHRHTQKKRWVEWSKVSCNRVANFWTWETLWLSPHQWSINEILSFFSFFLFFLRSLAS